MRKASRVMRFILKSHVAIAAMGGLVFIGACSHQVGDSERVDHYTGSLFYHASDAFPIDVVKSKLAMSISIGRNDRRLVPSKRSELQTFLHYYRDQGVGRINVSVPRGAVQNEAVRFVLLDIQRELEDLGFGAEVIRVRHFTANRDPYPVIQLAFTHNKAKGPECGGWNENWGRSENNANSMHWGCASQNNLAAMLANPRDIKGPRGWSPRDARRRDIIWDKFVKGESSGAARSQDERVEPIASQ